LNITFYDGESSSLLRSKGIFNLPYLEDLGVEGVAETKKNLVKLLSGVKKLRRLSFTDVMHMWNPSVLRALPPLIESLSLVDINS